MNQHERRPARLRRAVGSAALLLLVTTFAACGNADPTASPAATAEPPASVETASPAASQACAAESLAVAGGPWSAAAGSRGADVVVENQGDGPCALPAIAQVVVTDAGSQTLLESDVPGAGGPTLEPGGSAAFTVLIANWCDESVALPLHIVVRLGDAAIQVPGLDLGPGELPPCNGPGQPATVTVNEWALG